MKAKKLDGTEVKQILGGMITDETVCAKIASQWNPKEGLFADDDANLIAGWCVRHMLKYNKVLNKEVTGIVSRWAEAKDIPSERSAAVIRKLAAISDFVERNGEQTSDFILDVAGKHFNAVRLKRAWEQAELELDKGMVDEACGRMLQVPKVDLVSGTLIKPAEDFLAWRRAFDKDRSRALISYPGRLDWFLGRMMSRGSFIAFMGPDKSFKSFWLLDTAFRGLRSGLKVAYFEAGDLTEEDVLQRMGVRSARRPMEGGKYRYPVSVDKTGEVEFEIRRCKGDLTPGEAFRCFKKRCRNRDVFRLEVHPNSSIDVHGISAKLSEWKRTKWVADIVIIDYADILAPPVSVRDNLEQIDMTWRYLRRISQEFDCLLLTATQSKATAYTKKGVMGREHFGGRKTKLAHVNGMVGLNVTDEFRSNCVTGMNWVVNRKGRVSEKRMLVVAGCLDIANPAICCPE